ncbi:hypothetical protein Tco_1057368 [Tanacetum coccineum]|uniref:Uncharacterized protein n=1 Tax=Tanacetum coccineum TaxID=301880 RepID=A0ABQ5H5E6_9ASTR
MAIVCRCKIGRYASSNTYLEKFDLGKIWIPKVVDLSGYSSYALEIRKEQNSIDGDLLKETSVCIRTIQKLLNGLIDYEEGDEKDPYSAAV